MKSSGDSYRRVELGAGVYQCGCYWERGAGGDILKECIFHKQATAASVKEFERDLVKRKPRWWMVANAKVEELL